MVYVEVSIDDLKGTGLFAPGKIDQIYELLEDYQIIRLCLLPPPYNWYDEEPKKELCFMYVMLEGSASKALDWRMENKLNNALHAMIGIKVNELLSYDSLIEAAACAGACASGQLKSIDDSIPIDVLVPWLPLEAQWGNREAPKEPKSDPIHQEQHASSTS